MLGHDFGIDRKTIRAKCEPNEIAKLMATTNKRNVREVYFLQLYPFNYSSLYFRSVASKKLSFHNWESDCSTGLFSNEQHELLSTTLQLAIMSFTDVHLPTIFECSDKFIFCWCKWHKLGSRQITHRSQLDNRQRYEIAANYLDMVYSKAQNILKKAFF